MENLEAWEANTGYLEYYNDHIYRIPPLTEIPWTIGGATTNGLVLEWSGIEPVHCQLTLKPGNGVWLRALSGKTWRNGELVGRKKGCILRPFDTIALGKQGDHLNMLRYKHNTTDWPKGFVRSKYTLGIAIGNGASGVVYKCEERTTGAQYAIKVMPRDQLHHSPAEEKQYEKRFQREVNILKKLQTNHDHIIQLIEVFDEKPKLHIVLEYAFCGDFSKYLDTRSPLPEDDAVPLLTQICEGVKFIHEQNVAHRDLKPENILLTDLSPPKLKIADFGLSKLVEGGSFLKTQCGTRQYMAPELYTRANAASVYDNKVDIWSVGVIAFEMITKTLPFHWTKEQRQQGLFWTIQDLNFDALSTNFCTEKCIDLIENKLLLVDPQQRITISKALKHEWLNRSVDGSVALLEDIEEMVATQVN